MIELKAALVEVRRGHRLGGPISHVNGNTYHACGCGLSPLTEEQHDEHLADTIMELPAARVEHRVMTPQGKSGNVRKGDELGNYLRNLGWWTESQLTLGWIRDERE